MNDNTPWSDPRSYAPEIKRNILARTRPSLFYRGCDALAELIENIVDHPTTSIFLVFTGIVLTVFSAVICASFGL